MGGQGPSEARACALHVWGWGGKGNASEKLPNLPQEVEVWARDRQGSRGGAVLSAALDWSITRPLPHPEPLGRPLPPCGDQSEHKALCHFRAQHCPPCRPRGPRSPSSVPRVKIRNLLTQDGVTAHTSDVAPGNQTAPLRAASSLCPLLRKLVTVGREQPPRTSPCRGACAGHLSSWDSSDGTSVPRVAVTQPLQVATPHRLPESRVTWSAHRSLCFHLPSWGPEVCAERSRGPASWGPWGPTIALAPLLLTRASHSSNPKCRT